MLSSILVYPDDDDQSNLGLQKREIFHFHFTGSLQCCIGGYFTGCSVVNFFLKCFCDWTMDSRSARPDSGILDSLA